jgi:hypothetical protein
MPSGQSGVEADVSMCSKDVSTHQIKGLRGIRWKQAGGSSEQSGTR